MSLSQRKRDILRLLSDRGPFSNESIAKELIGDKHASASDIEPITSELESDGLIEPSEFAKDRWQITDEGQKQSLS